jgi:hypothetical protein
VNTMFLVFNSIPIHLLEILRYAQYHANEGLRASTIVQGASGARRRPTIEIGGYTLQSPCGTTYVQEGRFRESM